MRNLAADPAYGAEVVAMTRLFWEYAEKTGDTPLSETLYPALRLGAVGPLDEGRAGLTDNSPSPTGAD